MLVACRLLRVKVPCLVQLQHANGVGLYTFWGDSIAQTLAEQVPSLLPLATSHVSSARRGQLQGLEGKQHYVEDRSWYGSDEYPDEREEDVESDVGKTRTRKRRRRW